MPHFRLRTVCALALAASCLAAPEAGALSGVSGWAEPAVAYAQRSGLEPTSFAGLKATAPVTRAEFCTVALNTYEKVTGRTAPKSGKKPFSDCSDPAVTAAYELGLVNGRGSGVFDPNDTIQRQDLCVMLYNVLDAAGITAPAIAGDAAVEDYPDVSDIRGYAVTPMITMVDYSIVNGVAAAGSTTKLAPAGTATREQALIMAGRFADAFAGQADPEQPGTTPDPEPEPEPEPEPKPDTKPVRPPSIDITSPSDVPTSKEDKMTFVYGEGGEKYQSSEEARANMTEITIKVWRLGEDGAKTSGTTEITVNRVLAPLIVKIFDEIYEGDEQFPIRDVGCYAWRTGEHSQGTAIDINYDENMEATINEDGSLTPTTGTHWTPGEDPYSIPEAGDVVNAFAKYGFAWGGNAWRSKRDYMHFSFFGT